MILIHDCSLQEIFSAKYIQSFYHNYKKDNNGIKWDFANITLLSSKHALMIVYF